MSKIEEFQIEEVAPAFLAASADAVAVIGRDAKISTCNDMFLHMLDVDLDTAREIHCRDIFPDFSLQDPHDHYSDTFQPVRLLRPDGIETWILLKVVSVAGQKSGIRILLLEDPETVRKIVDHLDYVEDHDTSTGLYSRRRGIQELRNLVSSEPHGCCLISAIKSKSVDIENRALIESLMRDIVNVYNGLVSFDPVISRIDNNELMFVSSHDNVIAGKKLDVLKADLKALASPDSGVFIETGAAFWKDSSGTAISVLDQARMDQLEHGNMDQDSAHHDFLLDLRTALATGQMEFYIQPQVNADNRTLIGGELLIRWNHPTEGLIPPGQFIEHLEEGLFSEEFVNWSIIEATRVLIELKDRIGRWYPLSLNIAAPQFTKRFAKMLNDSVSFRDIPPTCLEVEITERLLAEDIESTLETLDTIRSYGFGVAIDDFGTGYSSLSSIRHLPLDRLKIDRAFVTNITDSEEDRLITSAIASLAHVLGLEVIAEGIETPQQASFLKSIGCEYFQGYLMGRPMSLDEFAQFVEQHGELDKWDVNNEEHVSHPVEERKIKSVFWKRSFSTDITSLDDEHKVIIDQLNVLADDMRNKPEHIDIEAVLDQVGEDVMKHFEHEERVMENINYDRRQSHTDKHNTLLVDYSNRREELLTAYQEGALEELLSYLKYWFLRHLISEDTRLLRFVNRHHTERR